MQFSFVGVASKYLNFVRFSEFCYFLLVIWYYFLVIRYGLTNFILSVFAYRTASLLPIHEGSVFFVFTKKIDIVCVDQ